jgi:putative phosphoesterase
MTEMQKILLLGDIHSNYPALKAVANYIRPNRFNRIVNTGDFTVYSTFPNETVQWFRQRKKIIAILGNTDWKVLDLLKGKKLKKPKKEEKRIMYFWTAENLLANNRAYLETLDKTSEFTAGGIRIGIFHGTIDDPDEELFPDAPDSRFQDLAQNSPYDIQIMGHSHVPYYKVVDGVHFINPGSVGRMFDGDPRASFAILNISSGKITVEHFRIPYAVQKVVKGLKKNKLPRIYTTMFQIGKKLN